MYSFDEDALLVELGMLPRWGRVAFAAAAATRQLSSFERLTKESNLENEQLPRKFAIQLWSDLQATTFTRDLWAARVDEVMNFLPQETVNWVGFAIAENALSSLTYAIRCLLTPEPQEAAWAARQAYEAADQAAIRFLGVQPGLSDTELAIKAHEVVQRELQRQRSDLSMLSTGSIEEVWRKAFENDLLSPAEFASLE